MLFETWDLSPWGMHLTGPFMILLPVFTLGSLLGTRHDPGLGIMEFAQPLHIGVCTVFPCRSLHSLFYHNFPST
jgi:hypothetical protein